MPDLGPRKAPAQQAYFNGDPVQSPAHRCDSCQPSMIQGVLCHERGCPDAWRDELVECTQCGNDFYPEERGLGYCPDCIDDCCPPDEGEDA